MMAHSVNVNLPQSVIYRHTLQSYIILLYISSIDHLITWSIRPLLLLYLFLSSLLVFRFRFQLN